MGRPLHEPAEVRAQNAEVIEAFGDTEVGSLQARLLATTKQRDAYEERYHETLALLVAARERIAELEARLR